MPERVRSWLFSPGDRPDRCRKAANSKADQVIWDLEDGVSQAQKDMARDSVVMLLAELADEDREPWVRINGLETERGREDLTCLRATVPGKRRRLVLPKATIAAIRQVISYGDGERWLFLIESARDVLALQAAAVSPISGLEHRLALGALDYLLDLGASVGKDERELLLPRTHVVMISRAYDFAPPIDFVFADVADDDGLRCSSESAKRLGYAGKLIIHPRQIEIVNRAFLPTAAERDWARRVLDSVDETSGAVLVDGAMVDRPVIERAKRILTLSTMDQDS